MQKALELFDQIEDVNENPYHKTRTIIFDRNDMAFIKEARAELEALQKPRSCFNCKYLRPAVTRGRCSNCVRIAVDRYEPKEQ